MNILEIPQFTALIEETVQQTIATRVIASLNAVVRKAVGNHLGRDVWTLEEIIPRIARCTYPGSVLETVTMDGEPILMIGQIEPVIEERDMSRFFCATLSYKILNEKETA